MVVITKKKGKNRDYMFREFTRIYLEDRISDLLKDRQTYKKPSQVLKEKKKIWNSKRRRRTHV